MTHQNAEYRCKLAGAQRNSFPSVVAGGADACVVHYLRNDKVCLMYSSCGSAHCFTLCTKLFVHMVKASAFRLLHVGLLTQPPQEMVLYQYQLQELKVFGHGWQLKYNTHVVGLTGSPRTVKLQFPDLLTMLGLPEWQHCFQCFSTSYCWFQPLVQSLPL